MRILSTGRNPRKTFRIVGTRQTFTLHLSDDFFAEGVPTYDADTETVETDLDANIDALVTELRYALYFIAVSEQQKH